MLLKKLCDCPHITAGDGSLLREILHPAKQPFDIHYSLAWAAIEPNEKSFPHKLEYSEVYYILKGQGKMHINNEETSVNKDDTVYVPPHATQFLHNVGTVDLEFLCIVDPPWQSVAERILSEE
ncbi:mannose-6-phosphate isomerase [candidate division WOR_3 bacterium SM23_42]|uniref:Mannose-6-phosphate isomerase n=1 Tax=candidate division WOR_3 bacterium SM23_42 TaxID=1703779 RepID=A0A0S8FVR6_UNCW3|nr:MAG: mannose-6-phosphate isomerase [candidate division WOR_3 bacterium SM23_42]